MPEKTKKASTKSTNAHAQKTAKKGRKGGISSTVAAGAAGAIVGAALGGATAAELAHEKTRQALTNAVGSLGDAVDVLRENQSTIAEVSSAVTNASQKRSKKSGEK